MGGNGNDTLIGGAGNDRLDGGSGTDNMSGGSGDDTYFVDNTNDLVVEDANAGTDTINSGVTYRLSDNVENLTLITNANINGYGNILDNTINGNVGNNIIDGGLGADTMSGGAGNDTYVVDNSGDVVNETTSANTDAGGTDTVNSSITYTLTNFVENLTLTGTTDINGTGNGLDNTIIGNTGNNIIDGGNGNDSISGGIGMDTLIGGAGNDRLDGGSGADSMSGNAGNDIYIVDNTGDVVTEIANEGLDTIQIKGISTFKLSDIKGTNIETLDLSSADTGANLVELSYASIQHLVNNSNQSTLSLKLQTNIDDYTIGSDSAIVKIGNNMSFYAANDTAHVTQLAQVNLTYV